MPDSDKPAANKTIQLDALDEAEAAALVQQRTSSAPPAAPTPSRRVTPPPLPPSAFVSNPPPAVDVPPLDAPPFVSRAPTMPPPRTSAQKAIMAATFIAIVAGAIAGGLYVGGSARGHLASPAASASGASGAAPPAAPASSASDNVLMLPTIEMGSQPSGN
jgi:hypothetical protein